MKYDYAIDPYTRQYVANIIEDGRRWGVSFPFETADDLVDLDVFKQKALKAYEEAKKELDG